MKTYLSKIDFISWTARLIAFTLIAVTAGWSIAFLPATLAQERFSLAPPNSIPTRAIAEFDANHDWSKSSVKSTDVLRGSYEIEGDAGKRYAWLGPTAYITLYVDKSVSGKTLAVEGWAPAELIAGSTKQAGPQTIAIIANGKTIAKQSFTKNDPFILTAPWAEIEPLLANKDTLDLEIKSDRSFVPSRYGNSPDVRDLALILKRIRFQ